MNPHSSLRLDLTQLASGRVAPWLGLCLFAAAFGSAAADSSLCKADEATLFDCPTGSKRIAVCASRSWSARTGWIQYRYGTPRRIELTIPANPTSLPPGETVVVGEQPLVGGGLGFVRFESGQYRYTVYSAISDVGLTSGVAVDADGENVAVRRCNRGKEGEFAPGLIDGPGFAKSTATFFIP